MAFHLARLNISPGSAKSVATSMHNDIVMNQMLEVETPFLNV